MALIKERLDLEVVLTPGGTGQFDVIADGGTEPALTGRTTVVMQQEGEA